MNQISEKTAAQIGRVYKGATIAWGRGECYDFDNPNPEIITIEDVAYALAYTPRFRGQTIHMGKRCHYGVGQHCVFGANEMLNAGYSKEDALAFLFHEADEVVLPDMPGPVKNRIGGFREVAQRQGDALLARFGIEIRDHDLIKRWDLRMLVTEKRDLMPGHHADVFHTSSHESVDEAEFQPFERTIYPYQHPDQAAQRFLGYYRTLTL